jgi:molecular chaperone DnaK
MKAIFGIDLGTTTTVVSRYNIGGSPEAVTLWNGESFIHSAIYFDAINPDEPSLFGDAVRDLVGGNQEGAFSQYKRDIGTDRYYAAHGKKYTPCDLTRTMLERLLKHLISEGDDVSSLTITVPANFSDKARTQTIQAAFDAGFPEPIQVIDEPTAAGLYYVHTAAVPLSGKYLVYDFGGGTLDVSVLEVNGRKVDVIMSHGVGELGGMDLDKIVYELIQNEFFKLKGERFTVNDAGFSVTQAEKVKEQLSELPSKTINIYSLKHGKVNINISRAQFTEAARQIFDKSFDCVENVLRLAFLDKSEINGVFMAGGTSNIPELEHRLEKFFGFAPVRKNPSRAIALGAAVYSAYTILIDSPERLGGEQRARLGDMTLVEACPYFLGTTAQTNDGYEFNSILIRKGMPRPASITESYYVLEDNQESIRCDVTQHSRDTSDVSDPDLTRIFDQYLQLPLGRKAGDEIRVTFSYDRNGVFKGVFLDVESGVSTEFEGNL